jgi:adenosine deaminase
MAQHLFGLTNMDLSEIALNSVKMSSFGDDVKAQWLGQVCSGSSAVHCTCVIAVRVANNRFRRIIRNLGLLAMISTNPTCPTSGCCTVKSACDGS